MYGWMGKILWVNLTDSEIKTVPTQPYVEKYLGGRGIASRIYLDTVNPEIRAFDPANPLIFMTGPLVATGAQGATRMAVASKSPSLYPEGYCYSNIGGFFGAELKKAGFDGVVIEGRAPKPVYLSIRDSSVELRDASSLWGHGSYRTSQLLQDTHGEKVRFIVTGVAGERLVRSATAFASHEGSARMGIGAVMGSKNLKALTVLGTGTPSAADPEKLKELNLYTLKISERLKSSSPPGIGATGHGDILEVLGNGGCYQCALECHRKLYRFGKRRELEGYRRCQAMEYYLPWRYGREDEPVDTLFDAPTLANDYSIDTNDIAPIIEWLYACYRAGALSESETNLPLSRIGTREFLDKLFHSIAYREGFGDMLAEGLERSLNKIPSKARALLGLAVSSGVHQDSSTPPGAVIAYPLLRAMEPRSHQALIHEISRLRLVWLRSLSQPGVSPVTGKVFHAIARAFWGSEAAGELSSYEGKALAVKKIQDRTYIKDSLGLCDAAWPIIYSLNTPDHVGDPDLESRLFSAVTGISGEEIETYAGRVFDLQRAILLREGRKVLAADFPPESFFTEGPEQPQGRPWLVPGPDDEAVNAAGKALDKQKYTDMVKEYYRLRGWDEETGLLGDNIPGIG
jgi:aldehyde:ferredoxin oxidoreductase